MSDYREILEWNGRDFSRFWSKVLIKSPHECWEWRAYRDSRGYGQFSLGGRHGHPHLAHRLAYAMSHRLLEINMHVLHKCDNPPCVNPEHLFLGTDADNVADCIRKGRDCRGDAMTRALSGRMPKGTSHPMARLSEESVRLIRRMYATGENTWSDLAKQFGVSQSCIQSILERRTWAWLD